MSDADKVFNCVTKCADRFDFIEQLSEELQGVNINAVDKDGFTALMYAVLRGGPNKNNLVSLLLDLGADCDIENNDGETALFMAIEDGQAFIVYQMLWLADKKFIASNGNSSLAVAKYFSSNMREIIPVMEAWGFIDIDKPTTYEKNMDLLYSSSDVSTCGGSRCGK